MMNRCLFVRSSLIRPRSPFALDFYQPILSGLQSLSGQNLGPAGSSADEMRMTPHKMGTTPHKMGTTPDGVPYGSNRRASLAMNRKSAE